MSRLLDVLRAVESSVSADRGPFDLFGLFRRRRTVGWEVVAAATWMGTRAKPNIELLVDQLRRVGGVQTLLDVAAVIVRPDPSFIDAVRDTVTVEHGLEVLGPGDYGSV